MATRYDAIEIRNNLEHQRNQSAIAAGENILKSSVEIINKGVDVAMNIAMDTGKQKGQKWAEDYNSAYDNALNNGDFYKDAKGETLTDPDEIMKRIEDWQNQYKVDNPQPKSKWAQSAIDSALKASSSTQEKKAVTGIISNLQQQSQSLLDAKVSNIAKASIINPSEVAEDAINSYGYDYDSLTDNEKRYYTEAFDNDNDNAEIAVKKLQLSLAYRQAGTAENTIDYLIASAEPMLEDNHTANNFIYSYQANVLDSAEMTEDDFYTQMEKELKDMFSSKEYGYKNNITDADSRIEGITALVKASADSLKEEATAETIDNYNNVFLPYIKDAMANGTNLTSDNIYDYLSKANININLLPDKTKEAIKSTAETADYIVDINEYITRCNDIGKDTSLSEDERKKRIDNLVDEVPLSLKAKMLSFADTDMYDGSFSRMSKEEIGYDIWNETNTYLQLAKQADKEEIEKANADNEALVAEWKEANIDSMAQFASELDEYDSLNGQYSAFTPNLRAQVDELMKAGYSEDDAILAIKKDVEAFRKDYGKEDFDTRKTAYKNLREKKRNDILSDATSSTDIVLGALVWETLNSPEGSSEPYMVALASDYIDSFLSSDGVKEDFRNGFKEYLKNNAGNLGASPYEDYKREYIRANTPLEDYYAFYSQNKNTKAIGEDTSLQNLHDSVKQEYDNEYKLSTYRDPKTGRRAYLKGLKGRTTEDSAQEQVYNKALVGYFSAPEEARQEYLENAVYSNSEMFTPEQLNIFDNISNDPKYSEALKAIGYSGTASSFISSFFPNWKLSSSDTYRLFGYFFNDLLPDYINSNNGSYVGALEKFRGELQNAAVIMTFNKSMNMYDWNYQFDNKGVQIENTDKSRGTDWLNRTCSNFSYFSDMVDNPTKKAVEDLISEGNIPLMLALGEAALPTDSGEGVIGKIANTLSSTKIDRFNDDGIAGSLVLAVMEQHGYGTAIPEELTKRLNAKNSASDFLDTINALDISDYEKNSMIAEVACLYDMVRVIKQTGKDGISISSAEITPDGFLFDNGIIAKPDTARRAGAVEYKQMTDDGEDEVVIGKSGAMFSDKSMKLKSAEIIKDIQSRYPAEDAMVPVYASSKQNKTYSTPVEAHQKLIDERKERIDSELPNNAILNNYIKLFESTNKGYTLSYKYDGYNITFHKIKKG
nr:MAG TPA: hypothetical protein [Bacteriophage sp.]